MREKEERFASSFHLLRARSAGQREFEGCHRNGANAAKAAVEVRRRDSDEDQANGYRRRHSTGDG